jgi:replicative DNA helicase
MSVRDDILALEDIVTACLLRSPALVLSEPLELSLFSRRKAVIHAMVKLSGRGITPDIFSIAEEVGEKDLVSELGFLQQSSPGSPKNFASYVRSLRGKVQDLTVFERLKEGQRSIAEGESSSMVIGQLVADSLQWANCSAERQYSFTAKEMMRVMVDKLEETFEQQGSKPLGLQTGISKLDQFLGGLHPSDMCIVGARPGVGKTSFGITVMLNAAKRGLKVGFISTEMAVDQIAYRVAAQLAKIDSKRFRKADFDDQDWARVTASVCTVSDFDIRICDKSVMRVSDVMLQCRAWDLDGGIDLVIVDYLTRIKPDKPSGTQNLDVGEIATQMKNLARDLKIPVIVLAQLNRQSANRSNAKPRMSDLRDSGIIEQEADSILLLHRADAGDEKESWIIIDKNRHGECVDAKVEFEESTGRWWCEDRDWE